MGLGVACFISAIFAFQEGALNWRLFPFSLCFGAFIIPIGVIGAYWQSYMANKLWGGSCQLFEKNLDTPNQSQ